MPSITLCAAFGVLALAYIASLVYSVYLHPLRKVPGPRLYAASRWPYIYATLTGQLPYCLYSLHQKYGPVVRTAPNEVSFIEEDACKIIHAHKDAAGYVFPKNYDSWRETDNYFMHSVFLTGNENHGRIRKALATAFSESMLREHESTIMSNVNRFIHQLNEDIRPHSGTPQCGQLDIDERFHWLAFDTVSEFVFGDNFDCLTSSTYRPWLRKLSTTWNFITIISSMKQIVSIATRLLGPTGLLQSRVDALIPLDSKTEEQLEKASQKPTLVSIGRSCLDDDSKGQTSAALSKLEIMANAALFTVAGTDTTATVMPSVIYLLLRNPLTLMRLRDEVRNISQEADITIQQVREMPYLTACIQEAMRMYPPVPEGLPRVVPGAGQEISGYWMPPKTAVQISCYAAYRSPINFDDPDSFIPERWLSDSSKAVSDDGRGVFRPFSSGPRGCIGQNFAMAEIRLALVKLLWHFNIALDSDEDWLDQRCFLLWEKKPLLVRLTPRALNEASDRG